MTSPAGPAWMRRHRDLQAQWREKLQPPPGPPSDPRARERYGTLPTYLRLEHNGVNAADEGLNLMSPAAVEYAKARLTVLERIGGVAEPDRLWRNLLSSQPLAFSIAGELRAHPDAATAVFSELTGDELVGLDRLTDPRWPDYTLDGVDAEWFPPRHLHTADRSGFDLAAILRRADGTTLLVTIEVKYVDTFSPAKLVPERYAEHLATLGLDLAAAVQIVDAGGSQFLRPVLLTDSVCRRGVADDMFRDTAGHALAVILARPDDHVAKRVADRFARLDLPVKTGLWTHDAFLRAASRQPALREWAERMADRYLSHPLGDAS